MSIAENIVTWGELPPNKRGTGGAMKVRRQMQMEALKSNLGKWGLLDIYEKQGNASSVAGALKRNGFEAATRKNDDGQYGLWARWTGENEEN